MLSADNLTEAARARMLGPWFQRKSETLVRVDFSVKSGGASKELWNLGSRRKFET
jgi:hypothetical protein